MKKYFSLFMVLLALAACNPSPKDAIVKITSGYIEGNIEDSIYAFKGIPYAQAERFMPSKAMDKWADTLVCQEYGALGQSKVEEETMNQAIF
ncbi:MAG: carboxylesterase family protein [Bacteroidales bacterium]|nr:carboxylesterase family protein [Bacteroidales bacterium]